MRRLTAWFGVIVLLPLALYADKPRLAVPVLRSPEEEHATFRLHPGFRVELVACEPQVVDPVSLAFDEDGRLFVCEMPGYPNAGTGVGEISSGRIKQLHDEDGDGRYEKATIFAEGLRFPMGLLPWKGGLLATVAPDILELRDTDGDGRADSRRVLYTGFGIDNLQQMLNSPLWGLDNWVYACNGTGAGTIRSVEKPDAPPIALGYRNVRFKPAVPGSLEPASGGGQYGLTVNANQDFFLNTNSEHLKQVVLPDHYLRRNPYQAAPTPWANIPEHGAACAVFRISPFEAWRVERTTRRAGGPDAARFAKTELVPGGFVTSACSPCVYEADRFPADYRGNVFICEPANNLVFRDVLEPNGPIFRARRADDKQEFLASTDNCFRPVHLSIGPDGALYVCDFYRPVVETPRSLPDDIKAQLPLESQGKGRIWRIVPQDEVRLTRPKMSQASASDLVSWLEHPNIWWRLNAQRVLVERNDASVAAGLRRLARESTRDFGRIHALWTLHGINALDDADVIRALSDPSEMVRCQALRLSESRSSNAEVLKAAVACADHDSPRVRLQAAFSLGESDSRESVLALARIARKDGSNEWIRAAILSSASRSAPALLRELVSDEVHEGTRVIVSRLAGQVAMTADDRDLGELLVTVAERSPSALRAIGEGMQNSRRPLAQIWNDPPPSLQPALTRLRPIFDQAARMMMDESQTLSGRQESAGLAGFGPWELVASPLKQVLEPRQPLGLQLAAIRSLAGRSEAEVSDILLQAWPSAGPQVRREIQEALFARPDRIARLVEALERKAILPQHLDPARFMQLQRLPDATLRQRAEKLLSAAIDPDRQAVIDRYRPALDLPADAERGKTVFQRVCASCHRLNDVGHEVGPDLKSALGDKTPEQLLVAIFDPNRELDRRYANYLVDTTAGRRLTGMIAAESATSLTLRRAEGVEDTVLRSQIESITDTNQSLMPQGLEEQLKPQDVADLLRFLRSIR